MPSSKSSVDNRDVYYRLGKSAGYRARSAYKLLHLDEEFDLFTNVKTAVDLCAAPGSWSQVLGQALKWVYPRVFRLTPDLEKGKMMQKSCPSICNPWQVDLLMSALRAKDKAPLVNITTLQTDITLPSTIPLVLNALGGRKADLVVCDGAPDGACLLVHTHNRALHCAQLAPILHRLIAVTGVHDLDAYLHSQLLLAVGRTA